MVKKIRMIDEEPSGQDLDNKDFQTKLLEYLQAIDWKLWEMLKLEQAKTNATVDKGLSTVDTAQGNTKKFKSIVIDE